MALTIITPDHQVYSNQKRKIDSIYMDVPNFTALQNKVTVDLNIKRDDKVVTETRTVLALIMVGSYSSATHARLHELNGDILHWFDRNYNSNVEDISTMYSLILKDADEGIGYPYIRHSSNLGGWELKSLADNWLGHIITSGGQEIYQAIRLMGGLTPLETFTAFAHLFKEEYPTEIIYHWDGKRENYMRVPKFTEELYEKIATNFDLGNLS